MGYKPRGGDDCGIQTTTSPKDPQVAPHQHDCKPEKRPLFLRRNSKSETVFRANLFQEIKKTRTILENKTWFGVADLLVKNPWNQPAGSEGHMKTKG